MQETTLPYPSMSLDDLEIMEEIGDGQFSRVYKAKYRPNGMIVALKVMTKAALLVSDEKTRKFIRNEIHCLKTIKHHFIAQCYQILETSEFLYVVMEYAGGGNMLEYINEREGLSEVEAKGYFNQIVQAVNYLHNVVGFVHRDLKLENVMLSEQRTIKLVDFGFATKIQHNESPTNSITSPYLSSLNMPTFDSNYNNNEEKSCEVKNNNCCQNDSDNLNNTDNKRNSGLFETICGSIAYLAPEILMNKPYDQKVDVWALGVILYGMIACELPFYHSNSKIMWENILTQDLTFPDSMTPIVRDLLSHMLDRCPETRYSIADVAIHPFLKRNLNMSRFGQNLSLGSFPRLQPLGSSPSDDFPHLDTQSLNSSYCTSSRYNLSDSASSRDANHDIDINSGVGDGVNSSFSTLSSDLISGAMDKFRNGAIGSFQIKSKPQQLSFVMKLAGNKRSSLHVLRSFKGRSRKSTLPPLSQPPDLNRTLEHVQQLTAKEPNVTPEFEPIVSLCV